jgi:inorganic pyrophosphatase
VSTPQPDIVTVVVEIPTGSRNKYELDLETGNIVLDRMLFTSMRYPADYGFIEGTLAGDGDTLDALVFVGEPTFPGCRIRARPIGLFRMRDEKGPDEKILCVPLRDPMWSHVEDLPDLNENLLREIEHFFAVYKDLEHKEVSTEGFGDRTEALGVIAEARGAAAARPPGSRS